jgi:hypothetical protein
MDSFSRLRSAQKERVLALPQTRYSANALDPLSETQWGPQMEIVYLKDVFSRFTPHTSDALSSWVNCRRVVSRLSHFIWQVGAWN